jgi:hypothetical protein
MFNLMQILAFAPWQDVRLGLHADAIHSPADSRQLTSPNARHQQVPDVDRVVGVTGQITLQHPILTLT